MKAYTSLSVAFLFFCLFTVSASAQSVPTEEPDSPFYKGRDLEWSTVHAADENSSVEHREYHRNANQEHAQWHEDNKAFEATPAVFDAMHRAYHQKRNAEHREFHFGPDPKKTSTRSRGQTPTQTTTPVVDVDPVTVDRRYEGPRPTRRSIIREARERNEERLAE